MYPITNHICVWITCGDHVGRYAVPKSFTVGYAAAQVWDLLFSGRDESKRTPADKFNLETIVPHPELDRFGAVSEALIDGEHYRVLKWRDKVKP